jgi:alanyl-tRNA synthetase
LKENFWAMGDTGPCGPCSEIFYDMGPAASDQGHTDCQFGCDCGRYMEIWNLVFMQFNRLPAAAGDASGKLNPLPKPSVVTGMGLERTATVLQGKISNYDTDLFVPLMKEAARLAKVDLNDPKIQPSLRIVADHSRAATFLISDGVVPSNDGRGYVLRKIIRRALRHAHMLNAPSPFLSPMSAAVRDEMKDAYPELEDHAARITKILDEEEKRFARTVEAGLKKFDEALLSIVRTLFERHKQQFLFNQAPIADLANKGVERISEDLKTGANSREAISLAITRLGSIGVIVEFPGDKAFQLYDTYGLPRDFIEDVAHDSGVKADWEGFDLAMQEQRTRAKASWKGVHKEAASPVYLKLKELF